MGSPIASTAILGYKTPFFVVFLIHEYGFILNHEYIAFSISPHVAIGYAFGTLRSNSSRRCSNCTFNSSLSLFATTVSLSTLRGTQGNHDYPTPSTRNRKLLHN